MHCSNCAQKVSPSTCGERRFEVPNKESHVLHGQEATQKASGEILGAYSEPVRSFSPVSGTYFLTTTMTTAKSNSSSVSGTRLEE